MCDKCRTSLQALAALTVVVIIIVALMDRTGVITCVTIGALAAFYLAVVRESSKCTKGRPKEGMTNVPCDASRLAQTGFDKDLMPTNEGSCAGTKGSNGSFCPKALSGVSKGAVVEAGVLNVLDGGAGKEGFWPLPGQHPPYAVSAAPPQQNHINLRDSQYKGAIDVGDYDVDSAGQPVFVDEGDGTPDFPAGAYDMTADDAWTTGHRDRLEDQYEVYPTGNPFDLERTAAPQAASPCTDDEANDDTYDIDERNTYQARSRNDATRVTAGTMRRVEFLKPFLTEEVEQKENDYWWGRHEV